MNILTYVTVVSFYDLNLGELRFEGSEFEFHTSSGDWVEPFDNVSVIQKFGLRSYFKQTCGKICEVTYIYP